MQFSSIWTIGRALLSATTPGQSEPGSDGNEGVLHIPQSSRITGTSPSDCLVSYQDTQRKSLTPQPKLTGQYTVKYKKFIQINQFSISTQFRCQNSSISSNLI